MSPKSVLVTGASSGIGLEPAVVLAEAGYKVYAGVRDLSRSDALSRAVSSRGAALQVVQLDTTDNDSVREAVAFAVRDSGGLHGVVNNAGVILRGYFEDIDEDEIRGVFDTNLFGAIAVTRAALPPLREAGAGRIVLMSSTGGRLASPGNVAYCASKFALEGFGECLRQEVEPFGVYVSLVEPGFVKTELFGRNRNAGRRADDPGSPYARAFRRLEELTDREVRAAVISPATVAAVVADIFRCRRPKLRYVVGPRAKLLFALRRYLPGETFDRIWMRELSRRLAAGPESEGV